jgi:hypothetical protein
MKKLHLDSFDKETLIVMLAETIAELDKKKNELHVTRERLRLTRLRFSKMKAIIKYQGERIVELHRLKNNTENTSQPFRT